MTEWDKNEIGEIVICPLEGYETATFQLAQMKHSACLVRLEYIANAGKPNQSAAAIQLSMTPARARELAQELLSLAERPHVPKQGGPFSRH